MDEELQMFLFLMVEDKKVQISLDGAKCNEKVFVVLQKN